MSHRLPSPTILFTENQVLLRYEVGSKSVKSQISGGSLAGVRPAVYVSKRLFSSSFDNDSED